MQSPCFALIPARKGSKGVPGKNWRALAGRPLIEWTIKAAQESSVFQDIVVSTDDERVIEIAKSVGASVPFVRPAELATDNAGSVDVALHAAQACGWPDSAILVLLQPTSPFRSAQDIKSCVAHLADLDLDACITVRAPDAPVEWHKRFDSKGILSEAFPQMKNAKRRQDAWQTVVPNGAVYAVRLAALRAFESFTPPSTCGHLMPSRRSLDIDEPLDFEFAEFLSASVET